MPGWALIFLIFCAGSGCLGFFALAGLAGIAKVLLILFVVLLIVSTISGAVPGQGASNLGAAINFFCGAEPLSGQPVPFPERTSDPVRPSPFDTPHRVSARFLRLPFWPGPRFAGPGFLRARAAPLVLPS